MADTPATENPQTPGNPDNVSLQDIRRTFIDYFTDTQHELVASSGLVPDTDPTLMFTNSGMVQFKPYFTGELTAPHRRAVTSQKCLRAGGKHNDLDNVGYTGRHHTFFEMLGNFSFGDYFKEQAIAQAWDLVTRVFGLPKERLMVTVYSEDHDSFKLWKDIAGLSDDKIVRIATDDNFWSMGPTGPCGPCSEIFYDHGPSVAGGPPGSPEEDGDRFVEIWNLVFMQYEKLADGTVVDLPKPCIDTGMGLERMAAILQGKHDNYDNDLFASLIGKVREFADENAYRESPNSAKVIADHVRSMSFLIAEGVFPSNEGRGYVLRRIMRRAMRHERMLAIAEPALPMIAGKLCDLMGDDYPELQQFRHAIEETIAAEEHRFSRTLDRGLELLEKRIARSSPGETIDGEFIFYLYDTLGFPVDLTQDYLRGHNLHVDHDGYAREMQRQRTVARQAWSGTGDSAASAVSNLLRSQNHEPSSFIGYDQNEALGKTTALIKGDQLVPELVGADIGYVIANQTPFYAESGGQVGDTGIIQFNGGSARVRNTTKIPGGLIAHEIEIVEGTLKQAADIELKIDTARRQSIAANHSATHLLHAALREVLGAHVNQRGSLVDADRLRFDFSHNFAMTQEQLRAVEDLVNRVAMDNSEISIRLMDKEKAIALGAMALFGEKYSDEVRVVTMGPARSRMGLSNGDAQFSLELCGGTHLAHTAQMGLVTILSESASGAGIRRIEASSGFGTIRFMRDNLEKLEGASQLLKVPPAGLDEKIKLMLQEQKALRQQLNDHAIKAATRTVTRDDSFEDLAGIKFYGHVLADANPRILRSLADQTKTQLGTGAACLISTISPDKASVVCVVTPDLTDRLSAVELVSAAAAALGGSGGGGRPDMAQSGGNRPGDADKAIAAVKRLIRETLNT